VLFGSSRAVVPGGFTKLAHCNGSTTPGSSTSISSAAPGSLVKAPSRLLRVRLAIVL
jgi:hypothetical protein